MVISDSLFEVLIICVPVAHPVQAGCQQDGVILLARQVQRSLKIILRLVVVTSGPQSSQIKISAQGKPLFSRNTDQLQSRIVVSKRALKISYGTLGLTTLLVDCR